MSDAYEYDRGSETWKCHHCGTILDCGDDGDPDVMFEMHEAICDQIREANDRMADARSKNPKDPFDQGGLISGGW